MLKLDMLQSILSPSLQLCYLIKLIISARNSGFVKNRRLHRHYPVSKIWYFPSMNLVLIRCSLCVLYIVHVICIVVTIAKSVCFEIK